MAREEGEGEGELLPGLPNEVALRSLAALPLDALARCRAVSRSWAAALHSPLRSPLPFACLCTAHVNSQRHSSLAWLFLSPTHCRSHIVPFYSLPPPRPTRLHAFSSQTQVIATNTNLLLVRSRLQFTGRNDFLTPGSSGNGSLLEGLSILGDNDASTLAPGALQGFDVWKMRWCNFPVPNMHVDRWGFATAHVGRHVYVAGGGGAAAAGRSAERLDMETGMWEMLPEMRRERGVNPAGFVVGGCFYVAGGQFQPTASTEGRGLTQSGEFFDPEKGEWTLVEGMWPEQLWGCGEDEPRVVVVKDVAYALSATCPTYVMMLNVACGSRWEVRGPIARALGLDAIMERWYLHLVSMNDDELWVIISGKAETWPWLVYACKPHHAAEDGTLHWEHRPFSIPPTVQHGVLASRGIQI